MYVCHDFFFPLFLSSLLSLASLSLFGEGKLANKTDCAQEEKKERRDE